MKRKALTLLALVGLAAALLAAPAQAQLPTYKMTTSTPHQITTPDRVKTPIGTLEFFDGMETGKGQVYLTSYKDTDDDWLDGARNYTLHIPKNAPAELFWSLTLYEVDGRDIIHNKHKITDRSSRMDLLNNPDGSVDLYFGPDEPKGKRQNWIPTEPNRAFFAMLRFYSPDKALLDRTWVLPDIEKATQKGGIR